MSVRNYRSELHNIPEECRSQGMWTFQLLYHCVETVECGFLISCVTCWKHTYRKVQLREQSTPITGLERPRGFQEVKVPGFHDNGTGWW